MSHHFANIKLRRTMEAATDAAAETVQEAVPKWDLTDLYSSLDDPDISRDIEECASLTRSFAARYAGNVAGLNAEIFARAISEYEAIDAHMGRLHAYAQLRFATAATDPQVSRFSQTIQERLNEIVSELMFFPLEINRIDDAYLAQQLEAPALKVWAPFLRATRLTRPYQLNDTVEKLLLEKDITGRAAWVRLFDETQAAMTVKLDGKDLPFGEALNRLTDPDRAQRHAASRAAHDALIQNLNVLTMITNVLSKDKSIEDRQRGYQRPDSQRHLSNFIEPEIVDTMVDTVVRNYKNLSHRYYRLKAKWLGLDQLSHWDRNAPLPDTNPTHYSWTEAKRLVTSAYAAFDPEMGAMAQDFLSRPWIDALPYPGKTSGAFAHPVVPSVHPYLLLNFHGKTRDVMTLAHELGHGLHQILAGKQGYLQSSTPLTLAETASVFGEMLVFRQLIANETNVRKKRHLIAAKVEDMLNTVVRQVAFYKFEKALHLARRGGELSAEQIGDLWLETQSESLGDAVALTDDYKVFWSYVPHFIHAPFYVYAYAFGDCLVNALYGLFEKGHDGFQDKYKTMLKAGGTLGHKELLAPFGIDLADASFWQTGLDVLSHFIDMLEFDHPEEGSASA